MFQLCENLGSGLTIVTAFSHAESPSKRQGQGHVEGQSSTVWCTSPSMASGFPAVIANLILILIPYANGSSCLQIPAVLPFFWGRTSRNHP